jgi:hypothetical protein
MEAKTKEVDALTAQIEKEQTRVGDLGIEIAGMENDLEDTQQSLGEDQKFIEELAKNCKKKKKEWAGIQKLRQEELVALTDTIKILNDDDALELFKKTLPSAASFVQLSSKTHLSSKRRQALRLLNRVASQRPGMVLIHSAVRNRKVSMDKVVTMIDDMVALLGKEQVDDDKKKDYCTANPSGFAHFQPSRHQPCQVLQYNSPSFYRHRLVLCQEELPCRQSSSLPCPSRPCDFALLNE